MSNSNQATPPARPLTPFEDGQLVRHKLEPRCKAIVMARTSETPPRYVVMATTEPSGETFEALIHHHELESLGVRVEERGGADAERGRFARMVADTLLRTGYASKPRPVVLEWFTADSSGQMRSRCNRFEVVNTGYHLFAGRDRYDRTLTGSSVSTLTRDQAVKWCEQKARTAPPLDAEGECGAHTQLDGQHVGPTSKAIH